MGQNVIDRVELIEGGYFEDTKVATAMVIFKKGRDKTTVTFADHAKGLEREVSLEEIKEEDCCLSVERYVREEEPDRWANFDPVDAEMRARNRALRQLKAQLEFSKGTIEVHEMLGLAPLPPISEFIKDINTLTNQYL